MTITSFTPEMARKAHGSTLAISISHGFPSPHGKGLLQPSHYQQENREEIITIV